MDITNALKQKSLELLLFELTNNENHTCKMALCKKLDLNQQNQVGNASQYSDLGVDGLLEIGPKQFAIQEQILGTLSIRDNKIVVTNNSSDIQFLTFTNVEEPVNAYIIYIEETNKIIGYKIYTTLLASTLNLQDINIQLPYNNYPFLIELN